MVKLGEGEVARMRLEFEKVDTDGNGQVDRSEMAVMFQNIAAETGQEIDIDAAVDNIFTHFDSDGNGMIDFNEYITTVIPSSELQILKAEFDKVDLNRDGKVNREELVVMFRAVTPDEAKVTQMVDNIFKAFDTNRNGLIDFHEYLNFNQ